MRHTNLEVIEAQDISPQDITPRWNMEKYLARIAIASQPPSAQPLPPNSAKKGSGASIDKLLFQTPSVRHPTPVHMPK